jgi:hypothetical protein
MIEWEERYKDIHKARVGDLGYICANKISGNYQVTVFGSLLRDRSSTIEEAKARAELRARRMVKTAAMVLNMAVGDYPCETCGSVYNSAYTLEEHAKTHKRESHGKR